MKATRMFRLMVLLIAPAALLAAAGCCPPQGVLAGSWNVTTTPPQSNTNLVRLTLGFDYYNTLTTIKYVFKNGTVTQTAADFSATTTVSGSTVTITVDISGATAFEFTGTLNSTDDMIVGTGSYNVVTNFGTITVPTGTEITLTKASDK